MIYPLADPTPLLLKLARDTGYKAVEGLIPLPTGSGSGRRYYRLLSANGSLIGAVNPNHAENEAFMYLTNHFLSHGLPVPRVLAYDPSSGCYLQEDLGDVSLFDLLSGEHAAEHLPLMKQVMHWLVQFQVKGVTGLDFGRCYPGTPFDRKGALRDLLYFKYMFLRLSGLEPDEAVLDDEFNALLEHLFGDYIAGFMYRDFQSRNIMIRDGMPWFIDYQGGRQGPLAYDAASLLYQSRLQLPAEVRESLILQYIDALQEYVAVDAGSMAQQIRGFALLRLLQTLGAYGFRGLFERKEAFIKPIPAALQNTLGLLETLPAGAELPHLTALLREASQHHSKTGHTTEGLTITIQSFSFMHGLPPDPTGNGGGFIFDCRALPNPYRDPVLRPFTGRDPQVAEWLSGKPEVSEFLSHCEALVRQAAENYLKRGFTHLQVNFGCTGGKHRSVFCAEELNQRLLKNRGGLMLNLIHRML
ncbi:MAG TPA: RNase adapter RapZ [Bacteroidales bacterium]|nr:RNase adapter RapZ [Bacteroidales bacterium]HRZ49693.1 RNase adapter RapZ [Bacteroidales bacterium]